MRAKLRRSAIAAASSAAISTAGYRAGALTSGGAIASIVVGTSVMFRSGSRGTLLLGTFFVTGSLLSRSHGSAGGKDERRGRNERQVLANGGIAAVASWIAGGQGPSAGQAMLVGSLAAATSDTWATEVGIRSGQLPHYFISGEQVPPGVSGGVSPAGTLASVAGALIIGGLGASLFRRPLLGIIGVVSGVTGSIVDSILGEVLQAKYRSIERGPLLEDGILTDRAWHASGARWVDNDAVNLACTTAAGLTAFILWKVADR